MSRVLKDDPMFSVPAHADRWTEFDDWVGHARRYEPAELLAITARNRQASSGTASGGSSTTAALRISGTEGPETDRQDQ